MTDRIAPNLPSRDYALTAYFYEQLGFETKYQSEEWLIMRRGELAIEFYHAPHIDPSSTAGMCSIYVDDLDGLFARFAKAGLPDDPAATPRLVPPAHGMFALVDLDGNLLRCMKG